MERGELLGLVTTLGQEFVRLHLDGRAADLRVYYGSIKNGVPDPRWSEAWVLDWHGKLRIPPYENRFEVLPERSPCPRCRHDGSGGGASSTAGSFPGAAPRLA